MHDERRRRACRTRQRSHQDVIGVDCTAATIIGVDDIEAGRERHRPDGLGGGDILPAVEVDCTRAERDTRGVVQAVGQVLRGLVRGVCTVVEQQRRITDLEGADPRERGLGDEARRTTVEHGIPRKRLEAVERESILTRADEINGALNLARPGAAIVILIQDERAGRPRGVDDRTIGIGHHAIAKEGEDLLDLTIEVESPTHQREVIILLNRVVGEKFDRAIIDDHLAAKGVRTLGGQPVDIRQRWLEGQHARPCLHQADIAVGETVTAIDGRDEVQITQRPEIERSQIADLIDDPTGEDRGGSPRPDENPAALERKLGARGQREVSPGLDGE